VILEQLSFHTNIGRNDLLSSNQSKTVYAQAIAIYHLVNRFLGEQYLAGSPDVVDAYDEHKEPGAVDPLTKVLDIHYPGIKGYLEMMRTSIREQLGLDRDNLIRKLKVSGPLTNNPAPHYYIGNGEYHMQSQYGLNEITVKVDKIFGMVLKEHNYDMYLPAGNGDGYLISKHDATMDISVFNYSQEVIYTIHLEKGQLPSFSINGTPLATYFAVNESSDIKIRIKFIELLSDVADLFEHISDTCFADNGSRRLLVGVGSKRLLEGGDGNQNGNHGGDNFCNYDILKTSFHRTQRAQAVNRAIFNDMKEIADPPFHVQNTGQGIRVERLVNRAISGAYALRQAPLDRLAGEQGLGVSLRPVLDLEGHDTSAFRVDFSTEHHRITVPVSFLELVALGFETGDFSFLRESAIHGFVFPLIPRINAAQQDEGQIIEAPMRFPLAELLRNDPQMRPHPGDQQDGGQIIEAPMRFPLAELLRNDPQMRPHRGDQEEEKQPCIDVLSSPSFRLAEQSEPRPAPARGMRRNKAFMNIHSGGAENEVPDIIESYLGSNVSIRNDDDLPDVQYGKDLCNSPEKSVSHPLKRGGDKLSNNEDNHLRAGGSHPAKPSQQPEEDSELTENERDRIITAIGNYQREGAGTVLLIAQDRVTLSLISRSPTSLKIRLVFHNTDNQIEYWFRLSDDKLSDGGGSS
jgi:hypothetical protein